MKPPSSEPIGLIAGEGTLPKLVAEGIKKTGQTVACIGLQNHYEKDLPQICDLFKTAGVLRIGKWIRLLRKWNVKKAIIVGRVEKKLMHDPKRFIVQIPDWIALKLWYVHLRNDKRSASVLNAVANELTNKGIELIDSTSYIKDHLAPVGQIGSVSPSKEVEKDIEFGWPILSKINMLKIGQALIVKERDIVAVEALEGTDAMIERSKKLCQRGGWSLLKCASENHDMRTDVPTIGVNTIKKVSEGGGHAIAIGANRTILVNMPDVIKSANKLGVALIGI